MSQFRTGNLDLVWFGGLTSVQAYLQTSGSQLMPVDLLLLARHVAGFDWRAVTSTLIALIVLTFLVDMVSAVGRRAVR